MLTNWQVLAPEPISPTQSRKTAAAQRISEEPNIYPYHIFFIRISLQILDYQRSPIYIHIIYFQSEYLYSCVWSMIQNYYLRRVWDNVSFRMSLKSTFLAFKISCTSCPNWGEVIWTKKNSSIFSGYFPLVRQAV